MYKRMQAILAIYSLIILLLIIRLFYFEIIKSPDLSAASSSEKNIDFCLENIRGNFLDKNDISFTNRSNNILAVIKPLILKSNFEDIFSLHQILSLDYNKLCSEVKTRKIPIIIEIDEHKKNMLLNSQIKGISIINTLPRFNNNSLAKHIIGYINKYDLCSSAGLEKYYNDLLETNKHKLISTTVDAKNNILHGFGYKLLIPDQVTTNNIRLTLDYHIQKIVEDICTKHSIKGAVVVEDTSNGDILAMCSKPDYDQNNISISLNTRNDELFNRAVASYDIGSVFKIIDIASAYEQGLDNIIYFCKGSIRIGNKTLRCCSSEKGGHGFTDI